jgi:hypothetical protein
VINGKTFDIPKVDLVRAMFKGSDADRAALREMWGQLEPSQKQELALSMANEMPVAKLKELQPGEKLGIGDTISLEGKEILDYMRGVDLPPERIAVLSGDEASGGRKGSDSSAGSVVDGNKEPGAVDENLENAGERGASDEVPTEGPSDDTRPTMQRRKLPDGMDPDALGLKDPNSEKSTSKISKQTPLHAERRVSVVEIPDPETGKPTKSLLVEKEGRYSDKDIARKKKAEAGQRVRDNDMESVKSYKDPETGVSGQGFAGRSAADMTERAPNDVYNDTFRQVLEGTRGEADRIGSMYEALRNNDNFHEDPRVAFQSPRQMAEALWRNADQVSFLEARNPVSPLDRRRLTGDIESENVGSRYLGLPDTTPGQAARMAQEAGMPTDNTKLRSRAEEDILQTIEKEVALRYGGSGWGRKYDEAGNLVEPGIGESNTPSNMPAVTSEGPSRLPEQSADQGLWQPEPDDPVYDRVQEFRQAAYRQGTQDRVGGLPMDNPGTPEGSSKSSGFREKPDNRSPAQIERDNADKQAAWEGRRNSAADRFNSYSKDKNMQGVIKTRRTAREVQADINDAHDRGADDAYIAGLQEELRQAKILDGITSRIENVRAKSDPAQPTQVGTEDDGQAVSTRGRQGRRADPHKDMKDRVRLMAEQARDGQKAPPKDPNADLQEAANDDYVSPLDNSADDPNSPNYIPPVNAMGEPDGALIDGYPEPGTGLVPSGQAQGVDGLSFRRADETSPEDMNLESAATPMDGEMIPSSRVQDEIVDAEFELKPDQPSGLVPAGSAQGVPGPSFKPSTPATPNTPNTPNTQNSPATPGTPATWKDRAWQAGKLGAGATVAGLILRAMLGSGNRGGLAHPLGGAASAGMSGGDSDGEGEGGLAATGSPYPAGSSFAPMSSADRIKLMQQMNSWQPSSGTQTAQSWRH